jgi:hypothetical protein
VAGSSRGYLDEILAINGLRMMFSGNPTHRGGEFE